MNVGQAVRRQEMMRAWIRVVVVKIKMNFQYVLKLTGLSKG